jgi:hypothetical protein
MGRVSRGTDIKKNTDANGRVLPDGRVTITLADGSQVTGTDAIAKDLSADGFTFETRLARDVRLDGASGEVLITLPDGSEIPAADVVATKLPDGRLKVTGRVAPGTDAPGTGGRVGPGTDAPDTEGRVGPGTD